MTVFFVLLARENTDLPRASTPPGAGFLAAALGTGTGGCFYFRRCLRAFFLGAQDSRLGNFGAMANRPGSRGLADILGKGYVKSSIHPGWTTVPRWTLPSRPGASPHRRRCNNRLPCIPPISFDVSRIRASRLAESQHPGCVIGHVDPQLARLRVDAVQQRPLDVQDDVIHRKGALRPAVRRLADPTAGH